MRLPEHPEKDANLSSEELEGLDEIIYVRPDSGASFALNLTAAAVLDLCNGQRTRIEIADIIADAAGGGTADKARVASDVDSILQQFVDCGLICDAR